MATAVLIVSRSKANPLTLWHLLSLDAPTVAALWTIFAARVTHTLLPGTLPIAMFLAVWLLYAADRLLDTRILDTRGPSQHLAPRHHFHRTHRFPFAFAILIAASALAILLPTFPIALLRSYLLLAAALLAWFALIHLTRLILPKEIVPGLFFAAAVFIPTHAPLAAAIAFAALCMVNCLYIYAWERPHATAPHITTYIALRSLTHLAFATAIIPLCFLGITAIPVATSLAALALFILDRQHRRLSPTTLRAAADLALLTPLLLWPFLK